MILSTEEMAAALGMASNDDLLRELRARKMTRRFGATRELTEQDVNRPDAKELESYMRRSMAMDIGHFILTHGLLKETSEATIYGGERFRAEIETILPGPRDDAPDLSIA